MNDVEILEEILRLREQAERARRWSSLIGDAETRERLQTLSSDYDAAADRLEVSLSIGGKSRASAKSPADAREAEREAEGEPVQHQQQQQQQAEDFGTPATMATASASPTPDLPAAPEAPRDGQTEQRTEDIVPVPSTPPRDPDPAT